TTPAMPPRPKAEPTAARGNMSDGSVKRLADHPWCAAVAIARNATAIHSLSTFAVSAIGTTASAHASMAVFRARLALHPRLSRDDESHPPPTLPMSATR